MSTTLNIGNYIPVWYDIFASESKLNTSIFTEKWGNADDFSWAGGLTITSYAREGWASAGFLQPDFGPTSSQGYGLYSVLFSMNANEGTGPAIVMWPANNVWPGPEIDLVEDWSDPSRQTGYATIHWKGADGSNQYQVYQFHADTTRPTQAAMDWEPGSLTFYVNGNQVFHYTGPNVPKDAADGGVNEAFGAEVTQAGSNPVSSSVSLHLYDMIYSKPTVATGASTTLSPALVKLSTTPTLIGPHTGRPADLPAISPAQGNATFTFESVSGHEVINNFLPSDTIDFSSDLRAALTETPSAGGLLLSFGHASSGSVLLAGVQHLSNSQIQTI
jgi:hypothetical protein